MSKRSLNAASTANLLRRFWALCLVLCLCGCASVEEGTKKPLPSAYKLDGLLSGQAVLGRPYRPEELPNTNIYEVTPEMVVFAQRAVRYADTYFEKVKALHYAMLNPVNSGGLGITYSAYNTENPKQVYLDRRANCLSFTLTYIALARETGIYAYANNVDIPPTWDLRRSGEMVYLRHVNVRVPMVGRTNNILMDDAIIDLEMGRYRSNYRQSQMSESELESQFYSNRAMEYLSKSDWKAAFLNLRKALWVDDQSSYVWGNLGSLYSRMNLLDEAELASLRGLELDPHNLTLVNNLAGIYKRKGSEAKALHYRNLAQTYREGNPYYKFMLAESAYSEGEYSEALSLVTKAIEGNDKEARFYRLAEQIYLQLKESARASKMDKLAKRYENYLGR